MALEGVIAQCYPIALLLVTHTFRKKNYKNDFLYYCAIGYAMTAFEQAWALLKSISPQLAGEIAEEVDSRYQNAIQNLTEEDFSNPYNDVLSNNPNYYWDDFFKSWFEGTPINPHNFSIPPVNPVKRPPVRNDLRFDRQAVLPIERPTPKGSIRHDFLKPPTPLEERVADRPPVSHIEWNPNTNKYTLRGTGDEELSTLKPGMPMGQSPFPEGDMAIHGYLGETPKQFQRKDYYRKLLTGLLNAGIDIYSDDRNRESNPFHQKFLDNLPPNLQAIKNSDASGKVGYFDPIHYRRKNRANVTMEELKQMQEAMPNLMSNDPNLLEITASDLDSADYGAIPIRSIPIKPEFRVSNTIGTRQTKLDEFRPPPPPTPPEGHIFEQLLGHLRPNIGEEQ